MGGLRGIGESWGLKGLGESKGLRGIKGNRGIKGIEGIKGIKGIGRMRGIKKNHPAAEDLWVALLASDRVGLRGVGARLGRFAKGRRKGVADPDDVNF